MNRSRQILLRHLTQVCAEIVCLSVMASGLSKVARANLYLDLWQSHHEAEGQWSLSPRLLNYSASSSYDANGDSQDEPGLTNNHFGIQLGSGYALNERFTLYGELGFDFAHVDSPGHLDANASGFSDQKIGVNYRIWSADILSSELVSAVDLQFEFGFPLYTHSSASDHGDPYLGDGDFNYTVGALGVLPFCALDAGKLALSGGLGIMGRSSGFSAGIPWQVSTQFVPNHSGLLLTLGVAGFEPFDSGGQYLNSSGTGGSALYSSLTPSLLTLQSEVGYRFESGEEFYFSANPTLAGNSAPNGLLLILGAKLYLSSGAPGESYGRGGTHAEFKVTRVNDRLNLLKLDHGSLDGVSVGQQFDIYSLRDELIAHAHVISVKDHESALEIGEYLKAINIETGFTAKKLIE